MISINLNAIQEWERVRRDTAPHTRDVDANPGTEDADAPELDDGSHGNKVHPPAKERDGEESRERPQSEEDEAYEVDIGEEPEGYGPPPDGHRAPVDTYQARNIDVEA